MTGDAVGRVAVEGAELVFEERGAGEPLVLVHGTGAQASTWGVAVDHLAAGGYRVLAYDRRGYGRSTHPPVRDHRRHVADLAAVLEHVGAPAHLLGWSSGGNIALALAVSRPDLVRSVVVMEAPWHGLRGATPSLLAALLRSKYAQLRGRRQEGAAHFFRWASGTRDGSNGFDRAPAEAQQELLDNCRQVLAELDPHPFGVMMEHVPTARLADIRVPVTWILGGESRDWYRRLHTRVVPLVPGIRTERIPGTSHLAHAEEPDAFAAVVLRALAAGRSA